MVRWRRGPTLSSAAAEPATRLHQNVRPSLISTSVETQGPTKPNNLPFAEVLDHHEGHEEHVKPVAVVQANTLVLDRLRVLELKGNLSS